MRQCLGILILVYGTLLRVSRGYEYIDSSLPFPEYFLSPVHFISIKLSKYIQGQRIKFNGSCPAEADLNMSFPSSYEMNNISTSGILTKGEVFVSVEMQMENEFVSRTSMNNLVRLIRKGEEMEVICKLRIGPPTQICSPLIPLRNTYFMLCASDQEINVNVNSNVNDVYFEHLVYISFPDSQSCELSIRDINEEKDKFPISGEYLGLFENYMIMPNYDEGLLMVYTFNLRAIRNLTPPQPMLINLEHNLIDHLHEISPNLTKVAISDKQIYIISKNNNCLYIVSFIPDYFTTEILSIICLTPAELDESGPMVSLFIKNTSLVLVTANSLIHYDLSDSSNPKHIFTYADSDFPLNYAQLFRNNYLDISGDNLLVLNIMERPTYHSLAVIKRTDNIHDYLDPYITITQRRTDSEHHFLFNVQYTQNNYLLFSNAAIYFIKLNAQMLEVEFISEVGNIRNNLGRYECVVRAEREGTQNRILTQRMNISAVPLRDMRAYTRGGGTAKYYSYAEFPISIDMSKYIYGPCLTFTNISLSRSNDAIKNWFYEFPSPITLLTLNGVNFTFNKEIPIPAYKIKYSIISEGYDVRILVTDFIYDEGFKFAGRFYILDLESMKNRTQENKLDWYFKPKSIIDLSSSGDMSVNYVLIGRDTEDGTQEEYVCFFSKSSTHMTVSLVNTLSIENYTSIFYEDYCQTLFLWVRTTSTGQVGELRIYSVDSKAPAMLRRINTFQLKETVHYVYAKSSIYWAIWYASGAVQLFSPDHIHKYPSMTPLHQTLGVCFQSHTITLLLNLTESNTNTNILQIYPISSPEDWGSEYQKYNTIYLPKGHELVMTECRRTTDNLNVSLSANDDSALHIITKKASGTYYLLVYKIQGIDQPILFAIYNLSAHIPEITENIIDFRIVGTEKGSLDFLIYQTTTYLLEIDYSTSFMIKVELADNRYNSISFELAVTMAPSALLTEGKFGSPQEGDSVVTKITITQEDLELKSAIINPDLEMRIQFRKDQIDPNYLGSIELKKYFQGYNLIYQIFNQSVYATDSMLIFWDRRIFSGSLASVTGDLIDYSVSKENIFAIYGDTLFSYKKSETSYKSIDPIPHTFHLKGIEPFSLWAHEYNEIIHLWIFGKSDPRMYPNYSEGENIIVVYSYSYDEGKRAHLENITSLSMEDNYMPLCVYIDHDVGNATDKEDRVIVLEEYRDLSVASASASASTSTSTNRDRDKTPNSLRTNAVHVYHLSKKGVIYALTSRITLSTSSIQGKLTGLNSIGSLKATSIALNKEDNKGYVAVAGVGYLMFEYNNSALSPRGEVYNFHTDPSFMHLADNEELLITSIIHYKKVNIMFDQGNRYFIHPIKHGLHPIGNLQYWRGSLTEMMAYSEGDRDIASDTSIPYIAIIGKELEGLNGVRYVLYILSIRETEHKLIYVHPEYSQTLSPELCNKTIKGIEFYSRSGSLLGLLLRCGEELIPMAYQCNPQLFYNSSQLYKTYGAGKHKLSIQATNSLILSNKSGVFRDLIIQITNDAENTLLWFIIGGVVGGLLLVLIALIIFCWRRRVQAIKRKVSPHFLKSSFLLGEAAQRAHSYIKVEHAIIPNQEGEFQFNSQESHHSLSENL